MNSQDAGYSTQDLSDAWNAAEKFLNAVVRGDEAAAKELIIAHEGETIRFDTMHETTAGFELGAAQAEGTQVVVVSTIHAKPGQDAPPTLPIVLELVNGAWKINMAASISRLMGGVDIEAMMEQAMQGMADTLGKAMGGVGQAIAAGMGAATQEGTGSIPAKTK